MSKIVKVTLSADDIGRLLLGGEGVRVVNDD